MFKTGAIQSKFISMPAYLNKPVTFIQFGFLLAIRSFSQMPKAHFSDPEIYLFDFKAIFQ